MATIEQQDTFTFEYAGDGAEDDPGRGSGPAADYLNNVWSDNLNHFDGEVPLASPRVVSILNARPQLRGLMAELNAAENQFWTERYAALDRDNMFQKGMMDFFRSCPQGSSVYAAAVLKVPGTYNSCPTLHIHCDNYFSTPPPPNSLPSLLGGLENSSSFGIGLEDESKTVDFRGNTLKGLSSVGSSARKQKTSPSCKICATFGLNTPPACPDNPESIYEAYKRNCTYRDAFEKQEVLDPRRDMDPTEPIRTLFEANSFPTLDEIGRALLPEAAGMVSPTTSANWVQELIDLLDPSPNSRKLQMNSSTTSKSASPEETGASSIRPARIRTKFSFPKLKARQQRPKSNRKSTATDDNEIAAPLAKLHRSKKLLHVKSRYLEHFQKEKATAAVVAKSQAGVGSQIDEAATQASGQSEVFDIGATGDAVAVTEKVSTTSTTSTVKTFKRPPRFMDSDAFLRLTRPRTNTNTPATPTPNILTKTRHGNLTKKKSANVKLKRKKQKPKPKRKRNVHVKPKMRASLLVVLSSAGSGFRARLRKPPPPPGRKSRTKRRPSTAEFMKALHNVEHVLEKYRQSQPQSTSGAKASLSATAPAPAAETPKQKRKPLPFSKPPMPKPKPRLQPQPNGPSQASSVLKMTEKEVATPTPIHKLHLEFHPDPLALPAAGPGIFKLKPQSIQSLAAAVGGRKQKESHAGTATATAVLRSDSGSSILYYPLKQHQRQQRFAHAYAPKSKSSSFFPSRPI